MIKVDVAGLSLDQRTEAPVVLLYLPPEEMCLPIWIGPTEAASIALALRDETFARPLTHDLLMMVIDGLGGRVERVVITDQRDGTYYARVFLGRDRDVVAVDARPSDSIALALRARRWVAARSSSRSSPASRRPTRSRSSSAGWRP